MKVVLLFCPGKARETSQIFSRTFKDSKKIQDFPGCGNPGYITFVVIQSNAKCL